MGKSSRTHQTVPIVIKENVMKRIITRLLLSVVLASLALITVAGCASQKPYRPVDKDGINDRADRDMGDLDRSGEE